MNARYRAIAAVQTRAPAVAANLRHCGRSDINSYFADKNVLFAYRMGGAMRSAGRLQAALRPWSRVLLRVPEGWLFAMRVTLLCSLILYGLGIWLFPQGKRR